jgi:undecaprenyl-diphosphatase
MNAVHALLLGIVEGLTEFLPVSSTGHLILAGEALHLAPSEFLKTFDIAIQAGAILAVAVLYGKRLLKDVGMMKRLAAAFLPTAVIGLALHGVAKRYLFGSPAVVVWALAIGGLILIVFEYWKKRRPAAAATPIGYREAVLIGCFQALAIVPGVSRSAATIVGALLLGAGRKEAVEFSFLLAVPTIAAAAALDLLKTEAVFTGPEMTALAIGAVAAFVSALFAIKGFLRFVSGRTFTAFGVYRIAVAALFAVVVGFR